jgi:hypothetical protein
MAARSNPGSRKYREIIYKILFLITFIDFFGTVTRDTAGALPRPMIALQISRL